MCASLATELGTPFVLQPANKTLTQTKQFEAGEEISYPFHLSIYPKLSSDGFRILEIESCEQDIYQVYSYLLPLLVWVSDLSCREDVL